jgi:hypothetical protein
MESPILDTSRLGQAETERRFMELLMASFSAPVVDVSGNGSVAYSRGTYTYATGSKAAAQAADSGKH